MKKLNILKSVLLLSFMIIGVNSFAQTTKKRPDNASSFRISNLNITTNNAGVDDVGNAKDNSESTLARVNSYAGLALIGGYRSTLRLEYSNIIEYVPANSKFYLKVNSNESGLLNGLLGGSVGNLLNGVLGIVIGGEHVTDFTLKNASGTNVIAVNTNNAPVNQDKVNFAVDKTGTNFYGIFYPTQAIKTIDIQDRTTFSVLGTTNYFDIYDAFYYNNVSRCDVPLLTSYTINSEQILSALSSVPVVDAYRAIDDDLNSYSAIGISSLLPLGAGNEIEQFVHLPNAINNKVTRFVVQLPSGLLSVPVGQESSIVFYKDNVQVGTVKLDNNLIGLDLLGLVNQNDKKISFTAVPRDISGNIIPFDKVGIRIKKGVDVSLANAQDIRIYDIAFVDESALNVKVCTKEFITQVSGVDIRELKFDIRTIIPNYIASNTYSVSDANGNSINPHTNYWQPLGSYVIKGITGSSVYCPQDNVSFKAIQDTQFRLSGKLSISMPLDANDDGNADAQHTFNLADYNVINTGNQNAVITNQYTPIQIFSENNPLVNLMGTTVTFPAIGSYNFYIKATSNVNSNCDLVRRVTVYVYDKAECEYRYEQLMANNESSSSATLLGIPLGGTSESALAIDSDLSTHGSIFNVVSLLGIGTTSQKLMFLEGATNKQIPPGTPLTIKLGQDFSLLQVVGAVTVQAVNTFGNLVGPVLPIGESDLANLLVGDNVFEFTFIPKDENGDTIYYSGVQVNLGSVLGLGNSIKVYGAFIDERKALVDATCNPNITVTGAVIPGNTVATLLLNTSTNDILWGTQDIGLGVATMLSTTLYAYQATDAINNPASSNHGTPNYDTYAEFNAAVGALNQMSLTVNLKEIARPGDKVRFVLGRENGAILDANVLGEALTIQRYMGTIAIGEQVVVNANALIDLDLLGLINPQGISKYVYVLDPIGAPFDRVEIRSGNIVTLQLLSTNLRIYDVSLLPYFAFDSNEETTTLCTSAPFEIEKMDPCTSYEISFAYPTIVNADITTWNDIVGSEINIVRNEQDKIQYRLQLKELLNEYNDNGTLYMKVVTTRQGCLYGDAQYLKVKLASCGTISNPMIRTRLKSN